MYLGIQPDKFTRFSLTDRDTVYRGSIPNAGGCAGIKCRNQRNKLWRSTQNDLLVAVIWT